MEAKYIKFTLSDLPNIDFIVNEELDIKFKKFGLKIKIGDDIGRFLPIYDFPDKNNPEIITRYCKLVIMDSLDGNKCRSIRQNDEEKQLMIDIALLRGFEVVDSLPIIDTLGL